MNGQRSVYRGAAHAASAAQVGIVLGSRGEADLFEPALALLDALSIPFEMTVASAHHTPDRVSAWAKTAKARGLRVVIAAAGEGAHLPAAIAALTALPVLGVPVTRAPLAGAGGPLAVAQTPQGVPAATFAPGEADATTAALFAARVLALSDEALASRLARHALEQEHAVLSSDDELQAALRKRGGARPKAARE